MSKFRQSLSLALVLLCLGAAFYAPMPASQSGELAWEPPSDWSARVLDWRRQSARIELSERFSPVEKHAAQQTLFEARFNASERRALLQSDSELQRRAFSASPPSSR